ncbi:MAG: hypothetical protein JWL76_1280 [Thermoleophilia bacterium]|nr:hypothetical protein [Thermoleophilia bacterium]
MHDTDHTTRSDDAADAIRRALPAPDQDATDRIARRIADGAQQRALAGARIERASRRPGRRRAGMLRPALAAGAVLVAGAVALLAPGEDSSSPKQGLLALGPDAAAAEVLGAVGDAARDESWHPLRAGEFHYTRQVERQPGRRLIVTSEQWQAADGAMHFRLTEEPSSVPAGETMYVPASECFDADQFAHGLGALDLSHDTLPVGSAAPACWSNHPLSPMLAAATGRVVAAPPEGAYVEVPSGPGLDDRAMRWGTEVFEGTEPQPIPPGVSAPLGTSATPVELAFHPFQMAPKTTWVAVESRPVVRIDRNYPKPTAATGGIPGFITWELAFSLTELDDLPADADRLLARLRAEGAGIDKDLVWSPTPGSPIAGPGALDTDASTMSLTLDLITKAPISPQVRAAAFEALGSLRMSSQPATVDRDAEFPDGSPAIAVEFPIVYPKQFQAANSEGDSVRMLFDPETAAFRSSVVELGTEEYATEYDAPERVTEIPPVG